MSDTTDGPQSSHWEGLLDGSMPKEMVKVVWPLNAVSNLATVKTIATTRWARTVRRRDSLLSPLISAMLA
jgi:hypothetical protein